MATPTKYLFSVENDFVNKKVNSDRLKQEILNSSIVISFSHITISGDECEVWFKDILSTEDENILNSIISLHDGSYKPGDYEPAGGIVRQGFYPDFQSFALQDSVKGIQLDPLYNQAIRGAVTTDEGSFRDDFDKDLEHVLTGTVTFTNGSNRISGNGTAFLSELAYYRQVKLEEDDVSCYVEISDVYSDTEAELVEPYIGQGDITNYSSPVSVVTGMSFKAIAGGNAVSFGLDNDGYVWSWGANTYGELGNDNAGVNESSPVSVVGGHQFTSIFSDSSASAGGGVKSDGSVWVWGRNNYGQLGIGSTDDKSSPVSVHNLPISQAWRLTKGFEVNILSGTEGGCGGIEAYAQGNNILTTLQDVTSGTYYMKLYDSDGTVYAENTGTGSIFPYSLTLNTIKTTDWTRWNGEVNVVQYSKWDTTDATAIVDWTFIDSGVWSWAENQPLWYTGTQLNNGNWAFVTVEREGESSPVTALNYYIADGDATTVVDQTLLTSSVYSDYFVGYTDVWMCDTDDGGFAVLYRVNDGENPITYNLYIRNSSGAEVETITGISVSPIDGRNIFNVGGRLWVCFWDGPVTSPDSGYIRVYEYDGTLTEEITLDAGFVGNNGYIGKPGYFSTTPNAVVLFGAGGKYKLYNNSDLSLYSTGTLNVNSQTPIIGDGPGTCLTRQDGSVVWVISAPSNNYMNWYVVKLDTSYF